MEERNLVIALLALGVLLLAVTVYFQVSVFGAFSGIMPSLFTSTVCRQVDGVPFLALPSSVDTCDGLRNVDNLDASTCDFYPAEKKAACVTLVNLARDRSNDCLYAMLLNKTSKYEQGAPEAIDACATLQS